MRGRGWMIAALVGACTPAPAAGGAAMAGEPLEICLLQGDTLGVVRAELLASGDTVVEGHPFSRVYADTGQYAATHAWYVGHEPIDYDPRNVCYYKYGQPRAVAADSLVRLGRWRGVPVFRERSDRPELPGVIYVAFAPGCRFQAYQYLTSAPPKACPQPERFEVP